MSRTLTPREAQAALRRLPDLAREHAQSVIDKTAADVAARATSKAPVLTGRLRDAIDWRSRRRSVSAVVGIRRKVGGVRRGEVFEGEAQDPFYWKFLEYGFTHTSGKRIKRPFFRPAAMEVEGQHERNMTRALEAAAEQMDREA